MGRDRAAYMRDYRARKKAARSDQIFYADTLEERDLAIRVIELEAEVARLKRELAERPPLPERNVFNSRPFQPAPKPGHR